MIIIRNNNVFIRDIFTGVEFDKTSMYTITHTQIGIGTIDLTKTQFESSEYYF